MQSLKSRLGIGKCDECGKDVKNPIVVVKHTGRSTTQLHFCNDKCLNKFYIDHLRESGL